MTSRRLFFPLILLTSVLLSGCQLPTATPTVQESSVGSWYNQGNQYSITINYPSPGGQETDKFNLTLEKGVITAASVEVFTDIDASKVYQKQFAATLPGLIIGKRLADIQALDVISGASLTTAAFNDALKKLQTKLQ